MFWHTALKLVIGRAEMFANCCRIKKTLLVLICSPFGPACVAPRTMSRFCVWCCRDVSSTVKATAYSGNTSCADPNCWHTAPYRNPPPVGDQVVLAIRSAIFSIQPIRVFLLLLWRNITISAKVVRILGRKLHITVGYLGPE